MLEINQLYVKTGLTNPDSIPYFLTESPMTVRQLALRLAEAGSPGWSELVARILRDARPEDALFFLNLGIIAKHWAEITEHLGPRRTFWEGLIQMVKKLEEGPSEDLVTK